ncbi:MAG TPA: glycosyltransferase 87 family protein [Pyrinomonadaceae bacterium]|nr:glycosyltransferase 87 family protein [Pyrinomonadaceae bacterium]
MRRLRHVLLSKETLSRTNLLLVALGIVSLLLYRHGLSAPGSRGIYWFIKLALIQGALYLFAAWLILRAQRARATLILIIALAALFRLSILFSPPYISDDIYRYIWDGRVQAEGINPYRYIPADESLAHLRDEKIYPHINRRTYARTIYPPLAEMIYLCVTRVSESVVWMKTMMVCFEALTIWALMALLASCGLPRQYVLIYAWHPLIVWEIAGSGHVDAAVIAFISLALLARRRRLETVTGVALGCATLIKLFPIVLFPALYRRWGWRMPVAFASTILIAYLPYLSVGPQGALGFLPGYAEEEGIQSGERFFMLSMARRLLDGVEVPGAAFLIFSLLLMSAIAVWFLWKQERAETSYLVRSFILAAVFTILLSPRYPWYFTWLVPFLCFAPFAPIFFLTTASFVLYVLWFGDTPEQVFVAHAFLYLPFAILLALAFWMKRLNPVRGRARSDLSDFLKDV